MSAMQQEHIPLGDKGLLNMYFYPRKYVSFFLSWVTLWVSLFPFFL